MKKVIVLAWMHFSGLAAITLFIIERKIAGKDALELYLSYLPLWLISYNVLETPTHRQGAIISCAIMGITCVAGAFYFRDYYLLCVASFFCAVMTPMLPRLTRLYGEGVGK